MSTHVSRNLLRKHVVVTLPCHGREVVRIPSANSAVAAVTMAATGPSAYFQPLSCNGTSKSLQTARCSVQVSKKVRAWLKILRTSPSAACAVVVGRSHSTLVLLVQFHHAASSEMQGICRSKQRKQPDLDHLVVQDWILTLGGRWRIAVLELSSDSAISSRNGNATGKDAAGLEHNVGTNPGQCTVDQGRRSWTKVLAGDWVNAGVSCQHVHVRNFHMIEEEETVVHGVVTEFRANVAHVDVLQGFVCLQVTDLDNKWMGAVSLSIDDQLCHHDRMVCSFSQRTNPPLRRRQGWGVDDEGLVLGIPCSGSFETPDVRSVS